MDGRIAFYSNDEKSEICKKIEELLNSNYNINRINRGKTNIQNKTYKLKSL